MTKLPSHSLKRKQIFYWITTILLAIGMLAGGTGQILRVPFNVVGVTHLGYPVYFTSILGTWKILGAVAILLPGYPLVKEWAYAGLFFAMTGAATSHIVSGDKISEWLAPFIFAGLVVASWALRPLTRKLTPPEIKNIHYPIIK